MSIAAYAWYWALGVTQGSVVLLPRLPRSPLLAALRPRWALIMIPLAGATAATFLPSVAAGLADDLSTLALIAVPILAVVASVWIVGSSHWALIVSGVGLLLAVAWVDAGGQAGDWAVLALAALSAAAVATLVVAVMPAVAVKIGIGIWALLDLSVALTHHLEEASRPILEATPAVGPHLQFQRIVLGSASMEWADLFVAASLGAVLVAEGRRRGWAAVLLAFFAVAFSVFFLLTDVLPATIPVALVLLVETVWPASPRPTRTRTRWASDGSNDTKGVQTSP